MHDWTDNSRRSERRRRPGRWRDRVKRAGGIADLPGAVFWGFGFLLPAAMFVGAVYALRAEEVFVPVYRGRGETLTGGVADGFGIGLIGLGVLIHSLTVWRGTDAARRVGDVGMILGGLIIVVGVVRAFL